MRTAMANGNITRRGKASWRLKYELPRDPLTGERRTRYKTIRGKKSDAEKELRAILHRQDRGIAIDPSKITVAEYLDEWLKEVAPQIGRASGRERVCKYV